MDNFQFFHAFLIYSFVFLNSLLIKASEKFLYTAFYSKILQYISFFIKTIENIRKKMKFLIF